GNSEQGKEVVKQNPLRPGENGSSSRLKRLAELPRGRQDDSMRKLRETCRVLLAAGFVGAGGWTAADAAGTDASTVFRGGLVVDGSGGIPRRADVWIDGGRIVEVGEGTGREA